MLSELTVETFYAYIPASHASEHPQAKLSQNLTYAIKDRRNFEKGPRGMVSAYTLAAERLMESCAPDSVLRSAATFVPVPGSTQPPPVPGPHHFISFEIAKALVAAGFTAEVEPILERAESVEKASRGGPRNAHLHRHTLGMAESALPPAEPVVLIDDVATTGAQLLGAAMRLLDAFPGLTEVQGFALIRAVREPDFTEIRDPVRRATRLDPGTDGTCTFDPL